MLFIDPGSPNIVEARKTHERILTCFITKRTGQPGCGKNDCHICKHYKRPVPDVRPEIAAFLTEQDNLSQILSGPPEKLDKLNRDSGKKLIPGKTYEELIPFMQKVDKDILAKKPAAFQQHYQQIHLYAHQLREIFDYEWFSKKAAKPYNAYALSKSLDRYTCSYCNRNFTSTVIAENQKLILRPTLDHWFPKSLFPLLALSFYNLIPSCHPCNSSIRGVAAMTLTGNIHPYHDKHQSDHFEFDYVYRGMDDYRISIRDTESGKQDNSRARKTMEEMQIAEIYNANVSELRDLLIIKRNYSAKYIDIMQSQLKTRLNKGDVYRILFGTTYEEANYHKRPLSKFKKDILKKLGMLDYF